MTMVAEGVKTAGLVMELADRYGVELPICSRIHGVVAASSRCSTHTRGSCGAAPGHEAEPG